MCVRNNILVTGGGGFLGSYLVPFLSENNTVLSPSKLFFDITQPNLSFLQNCSTVINLAAYTNVSQAENNQEEAFKINAEHLDWLAFLNKDVQIYHISTDYVYDMNTSNSKETDTLNPFCVYGYSKAAGDTRLLSYCNPNIHIIRTSFKPIRWEYPIAFTNVITNADTVNVIARMIADFILLRSPGGVYNLGTEPKTIYELAKRNNPHVRPGFKEGNEIVDVTMNLNKYMKTIRKKF